MGQSNGCACCNNKSNKVVRVPLVDDVASSGQRSRQADISSAPSLVPDTGPGYIQAAGDDLVTPFCPTNCPPKARDLQLTSLGITQEPSQVQEVSGLAWAKAAHCGTGGTGETSADQDVRALVQELQTGPLRDNAKYAGSCCNEVYTPKPKAFEKFDSETTQAGVTVIEQKPGCCSLIRRKKSVKVSLVFLNKVKELFDSMDKDGNGELERTEALQFFKGKFGALSVEAMFNEVDADGNQCISKNEFVEFWIQVVQNGYREEDVIEEMNSMLEGGGWVDFNDDRNVGFVKDRRSKASRNS